MLSNFVQPTNLRDALTLRAGGEITPLAGGTDVYPAMTNGLRTKGLLDLSRIREFGRALEKREGAWFIPPLTTWTDIAEASLPPQFAGVQAAAIEVGGRQVQNRGTIVGNICNASPAADGIAALMALDAKVKLASLSGERILPLSEFVLGNRKTECRPEELVVGIQVPDWGKRTAAAFSKLGSRRYLVISIVMVAVTLSVDEKGRITQAAVAVGSCAPRSVRLASVEAHLLGKRIDETLIARIAPMAIEGLAPIDDIRASARYRLAIASKVFSDALENCQLALSKEGL